MHALDLHEAIADQMDREATWADASPQQRIDEHRRRLEAIRSGQTEAPPVPSGWADAGMERIKAESRQPQPDHSPTTTRPRFTRRPGADQRSFVTDSGNSRPRKRRRRQLPSAKAEKRPSPKPKPPAVATTPETAVKQDWRTCGTCGEPIKTKWTGRPPKYCGNACKQKAYRERHKVKEAMK